MEWLQEKIEASTELSQLDSAEAIDRIIEENELGFYTAHMHPQLNLILFVLNNGEIVQIKYLDYPGFHYASSLKLYNFRFEEERKKLFWPELQYELGLKELLLRELQARMKKGK